VAEQRSVDAVVIGAGVIGCAIALELSRKGYRVLVVDRLPAAGYGPTSSSSAIVRTHYSTWDGVAMSYEGYFYWRDWHDHVGVRDELGAAKFVDTGSLILKNRGYDHARAIALFDEVGVAYEEWDLETLGDRFPLFDLHTHWPPRRPEEEAFWDEPAEALEGALFTPESGFVTDPQLATHNLMRAAEAQGGAFRFRAEVAEIRRDGGRVGGVTLSDGERIDAPVVVNVAGPHSARINRMAGVQDGMRIGTRALRQEVHYVPSPPGFDFGERGCYVFDGDTGVYFRPEVGNTILVGSEDPECDPREWVDDPDDYDREVSDAQWRAQVYRLAKRIPSLPIPSRPSGLVDLYDVSDDWIPIYDRSDLPGFYMAVGTSGNQFKNAGVAAHLMAELIDACENGHDHDRDPLRVKCRHSDRVLNA
jgi:sarcosine oxidase subunit beta